MISNGGPGSIHVLFLQSPIQKWQKPCFPVCIASTKPVSVTIFIFSGLNMLQSGLHKQHMKDLFVELCLTVPVRLSSLLPYLPMLMDPLVSALNGSQTLVSQGLRTLELCVDNLQPDFLYDHIQPVRAELMQVMLAAITRGQYWFMKSCCLVKLNWSVFPAEETFQSCVRGDLNGICFFIRTACRVLQKTLRHFLLMNHPVNFKQLPKHRLYLA